MCLLKYNPAEFSLFFFIIFVCFEQKPEIFSAFSFPDLSHRPVLAVFSLGLLCLVKEQKESVGG